MADPQFTVTRDATHEMAGSGLVLKIAGEIDILTSPVLEQQLVAAMDEGMSSILIDLSKVTFLDSTGLNVFLSCLQRCQGAGRSLRLISPQSNVRRVLEITGLTDVFGVANDGEGTSN